MVNIRPSTPPTHRLDMPCDSGPAGWRGHYDQVVDLFFSDYKSEATLSSSHQDRLEQYNRLPRQVLTVVAWLLNLAVILPPILMGQRSDPFLLAFGAFVLPLALLTCKSDINAPTRTMNQTAQQMLLGGCLVLPSMSDVGTGQIFLVLLFMFAWNELTVRRFRVLLFNHAVTTTLFLTLQHDAAPLCSGLSVLMIAISCLRRASLRSMPEEECTDPQLSGLSTLCENLVRLVLDGGDDLCQDSKESLHEVISLISGTPHQVSELSCSHIGQGSGSGYEHPSPCGPEGPGLHLLAGVALEPSREEDFDGFNGPVAIATKIEEAMRIQHPESEQETSPYTKELVNMTFDAMAEVQMCDGMIMWANQSFYQLATAVGNGSQEQGIKSLQEKFFQSPTADIQCSMHSFKLGSSPVDIWSVCRLVGSPGQERVLWVINKGLMLLGPGLQPEPAAPETPEELSASHTEFPKASDYIDPQVRIMCDLEECGTGRGRRQVQMLWRKYGEKNLLKPAKLGGDVLQPRMLDRQYYKLSLIHISEPTRPY
eukprot:TRINITY_DN1696_c0_g2_i1.p1 TRINITY_DN1696_c0_g2~~TRINITY_DN1696_c0_g2_i1.p1  ORF type:complete len:539 (-),score=60.77 TRINITY_DN1696_c0_g2_i1:70-1686(-)